MTSLPYLPYMHGALTALCVVVALYFLRLWRRARERFYLFFSIAFAVFAVQWAVLGTTAENEHGLWPYATRLVAFLLILVAIIDKNRRA